MRKLWRLPYTTHCNLLHTINNSLPIEISLEKRSVKSIWSWVNSKNDLVKTITRLATKLPRSVFGQSYRYFSYKYSILPHEWYESYNSVHHSIMDYISQNCTEISLEKRSVKSIWSCVNSKNDVVKTITRLATKLPRSVFGQNYRYFSYKYSILPQQWYESYNSVHHSIMDYISQNCTDHNYGILIRDLCFYRDSCDHMH